MLSRRKFEFVRFKIKYNVFYVFKNMSQQWLKLFKENKWAFVAYTGQSNRLNTTRWHIVKADSWTLLRHQLESFGAESVESSALGFTASNPYNGRPPFNTVIRGYVVFKPTRKLDAVEKFPEVLKTLLSPAVKNMSMPEIALTSKDYVMPNYFLFLVREPLPLGGRPFVPLEEKANYALLEHQQLLGSDVSDKLNDLKDDHKDRFHATDADVLFYQETSKCNGLGTTLVTPYLKPPKDYLCPECQSFGQHYRDACYLWRTTGPKEVAVPFGPKKFGSLEAPKEDDAFYYSMMHKRATKV